MVKQVMFSPSVTPTYTVYLPLSFFLLPFSFSRIHSLFLFLSPMCQFFSFSLIHSPTFSSLTLSLCNPLSLTCSFLLFSSLFSYCHSLFHSSSPPSNSLSLSLSFIHNPFCNFSRLLFFFSFSVSHFLSLSSVSLRAGWWGRVGGVQGQDVLGDLTNFYHL